MQKKNSGHKQPQHKQPAGKGQADVEGGNHGKRNNKSNDDFGASQQPKIGKRMQHFDSDVEMDMLENGMAAARYLKTTGNPGNLLH